MWVRTHLERQLSPNDKTDKDALVNFDQVRSVIIIEDPQGPGRTPLWDLRAIYEDRSAIVLATEESDEPKLTRLLFSEIKKALQTPNRAFLDLNIVERQQTTGRKSHSTSQQPVKPISPSLGTEL